MASRMMSIVLVTTCLMGCGTIFNGTRQDITANSTPEAAKVTTTPSTGEFQTPITLRLERKKSYTIRFERDGYAPQMIEIQNKVQPIVLVGDILFGLIPVIVDAATGGWYRLSPPTALVAMTRLADAGGPEKIWIGMTRQGRSGPVAITSSDSGVRVHVEEK